MYFTLPLATSLLTAILLSLSVTVKGRPAWSAEILRTPSLSEEATTLVFNSALLFITSTTLIATAAAFS